MGQKSKLLESGGSQTVIREAIRRIALGRSIDRVDMSPGGTGGVGTARLIHGYVAKVHDDPSDAEFAEYGGTIDVGEYPDETASTEPIIHKGVLLAGTQDNSGGVLLVPTLLSDVTIVTSESSVGTSSTPPLLSCVPASSTPLWMIGSVEAVSSGYSPTSIVPPYSANSASEGSSWTLAT